LGVMEREFSGRDENDPRAMAQMMRRMAELSGERIPAEVEDVVRQLEEGVEPELLEQALDAPADPALSAPAAPGGRKLRRIWRGPPRRDPQLYDYA
jgi:hypothetical protein